MKLPDGIRFAIGGRTFEKEIPDNLVTDDVKKALSILVKAGKEKEKKEAK